MSIFSSRCSALVLLTACGRVGFDSRGDARDAAAVDAPGDVSGDAVNAGLVAWWPLDEGTGLVAHDAVGTADGTVGAALAWAPGRFGDALSFSGDGTDVMLGSPPSITNLPALTISAWLEPSQLTHDGNSHCYFDKGDSAPAGGWSVAVANAATGDVGFVAFFPGGVLQHVSTANRLVVGQWTHVVVTWDGSALAAGSHVYVDGAEVQYAAAIDASGARPDDSMIGGAIGCISSTSFAGLEDDVKIYDRVLSPSEIQHI